MPKLVNVCIRGLFHNAKPFCGKIRFKLNCCAKINDALVFPQEWDEYPFDTKDEKVFIKLIPNTETGEGSFYYYEIEYCQNSGAYIYDKYGKHKMLLKGVCVVPNYDCNFVDIATVEAPEANGADLAKAYASQAKVSTIDAQKQAALALECAEKAEENADKAQEIFDEIKKTESGGHFTNYNNPHKVTAEQIGAVTKEEVEKQGQTIATHTQEIEALQEASEATNKAVAQNAFDISANTNKIQTNQEALAQLQPKVNSNTKAIQALQEADNAINEAVNNKANASALATTNANVESNSKAIATNKASIEQANAYTASHINNTSNPHKVTAEQLIKKSASAGRCDVRWGNSNYYKQGEVIFHFDPAMYRRGYGYTEIKIPDYMTVDGVDIGGVTVDYYGEFVFAEQGNHSGWVFRTTETENVNGLELYIFVSISIPDLLKKDTSYAVWVGVGTTQNCADYAHSAEIVTAGFDSNTSYAAITYNYYEQSGVYRVLTEEQLRDKKTGLPYTLAVENGQLRLVRYSENEF